MLKVAPQATFVTLPTPPQETSSALVKRLQEKCAAHDNTKVIWRATQREELFDYVLHTLEFLEPIQHLFKTRSYQAIFSGKASGVSHLEGVTKLSVIALDEFPGYILKIPSEDFDRWGKDFRTSSGRRHPCEKASLVLRPSVAYLMRKVIQDYDLNLLQVPRKWIVPLKKEKKWKIGVLAERCSLASVRETERFLRNLSEEKQCEHTLQIAILIALTGYQDVGLRNIRWDPKTDQLVFFDTEPYGNIEFCNPTARDARDIEKDLALVGLKNLKKTLPFSEKMIEEVIDAVKEFFDLKSYIF